MNSQAEDRLIKMLAEGKITPDQFKELRAEAEQAKSDEITPITPASWAKPTFTVSFIVLLLGIAGQMPFVIGSAGMVLFISAYALGITKKALGPEREFRTMLLKIGLVMCVIGIPAGIALNQPAVWGLGILGTAIAYWKLQKMHSQGSESK